MSDQPRLVVEDRIAREGQIRADDREGSRTTYWSVSPEMAAENEERALIRERVQEALLVLDEDERVLINLVYWQGESLESIGRELNREPTRLRRLHRQALAKLRGELAGFARDVLDIRVELPDCAICRAANPAGVEELIGSKREEETWRRIVLGLRERFGVAVGSPQTIIAHVRYHYNLSLAINSGECSDEEE